MSDNPLDSPPVDPENDGAVRQVIESLESILEAFPEDVSALQSLMAAHEEAGDLDKAREYSIRLAQLLSQQGDWEQVRVCALHLLELDPTDEDAAALCDQAQEILMIEGDDRVADRVEGGGKAPAQLNLDFDLSGELELAWFLLQHELINQEQYETAIAGLTESRMSANAGASLSLLQELAGMERVNMDRIIGLLSAETAMPFIDVSRFDIAEEVYRMIPYDKIRRLGVLPFDRVGREILVATLNPVDENQRTAVAAFLATKVHFYLTSPEEFQKAAQEIGNRLQKGA